MRAVTRSVRMRCAGEGCRPVRAERSFKLTGSGWAARASSSDTIRSMTWIAVLPCSVVLERGRGIGLAKSQCCHAGCYITWRNACHSNPPDQGTRAFAHEGGAPVDEAGVYLDQRGAGLDLGAGVGAAEDSADSDHRIFGG